MSPQQTVERTILALRIFFTFGSGVLWGWFVSPPFGGPHVFIVACVYSGVAVFTWRLPPG